MVFLWFSYGFPMVFRLKPCSSSSPLNIPRFQKPQPFVTRRLCSGEGPGGRRKTSKAKVVDVVVDVGRGLGSSHHDIVN